MMGFVWIVNFMKTVREGLSTRDRSTVRNRVNVNALVMCQQ